MTDVTHYVGDSCEGGHRDEWAMTRGEFFNAMTDRPTDDEAKVYAPLLRAVMAYGAYMNVPHNRTQVLKDKRAAVIETARLLVAMVRAEEAHRFIHSDYGPSDIRDSEAAVADARAAYMKAGEGA